MTTVHDALAIGLDLVLVPTGDGGRQTSLRSATDQLWSYRPNWQLPSMLQSEQTGAPVWRFSVPVLAPGERARAVIVPLFPDVLPRWRAEIVPGVRLPMFEGPRDCGHGTVRWMVETCVPLGEQDQGRFERWLLDPAAVPSG